MFERGKTWAEIFGTNPDGSVKFPANFETEGLLIRVERDQAKLNAAGGKPTTKLEPDGGNNQPDVPGTV
jgi:hypothetical protein